MKPICKFEIENKGAVKRGENVVEARILDKRYCIEIVRDVAYAGTFRIFDGLDDFKLLHEEPTTVSYDAIFGPDVYDVQEWENLGIDIVDNNKFNVAQPKTIE